MKIVCDSFLNDNEKCEVIKALKFEKSIINELDTIELLLKNKQAVAYKFFIKDELAGVVIAHFQEKGMYIYTMTLTKPIFIQVLAHLERTAKKYKFNYLSMITVRKGFYKVCKKYNWSFYECTDKHKEYRKYL